MPMNFECGQGVSWFVGQDPYFGVVTGTGDTLEIAPVFQADAGTRCYDEGGAAYANDRHKVRPRGCPPPFTLAYAFQLGNYGGYVDADPDRRVRVSTDTAMEAGIQIIDDGEKVPDEVLAAIYDHPWRDEKQFQAPYAVQAAVEPAPEPQGGLSALERLMAGRDSEPDDNKKSDFEYDF